MSDSNSGAEGPKPPEKAKTPRGQSVARQVGAWVKEFQQRRVEERMRSFDSLFQRA
jgi:hypothetical protein